MTCGRTLAWPALKTSELKTPEFRTPALRSCRECERFRLDRVLPPPGKALRLAIARLRRGSRGHRRLSGERALHITGVTLVEDRGRDRPQADFTVLIPTNRMGLCPELVSTH
jgi:hypothetical protein